MNTEISRWLSVNCINGTLSAFPWEVLWCPAAYSSVDEYSFIFRFTGDLWKSSATGEMPSTGLLYPDLRDKERYNFKKCQSPSSERTVLDTSVIKTLWFSHPPSCSFPFFFYSPAYKQTLSAYLMGVVGVCLFHISNHFMMINYYMFCNTLL